MNAAPQAATTSGEATADTLRVAPGIYISWGSDGPRIGHVDRPFDLFEVSADIAALVAQFSHPRNPTTVLHELGIGATDRAAALHALNTLQDAGLLLPSTSTAHPPYREEAFEAPRATNSCPDIAQTDPEFSVLYQELATSTLTSPQLGYALRSALTHLARTGVRGDVVECGVWRGGSMALAAKTLLKQGDDTRHLWLYDTFDWRWEQAGPNDGFVAADSPAGAQPRDPSTATISAKATDTSTGHVRRLLLNTGYPGNQLHLVQGLVQETIPDRAPDHIALLRLDTDQYDSTLHELKYLYPRLVHGGVLIVDDYAKLSGATRAVDEYFADMPDSPYLQRVDIQGRVGVKP